MPYHQMDAATRAALLEPPTGPCEVVIDTDAYNEIDDQFAIVHALYTEKFDVKAMYAVPFHNEPRATVDFADGMEKSYDEIFRLLERIPGKYDGPVLKGSRERMTDTNAPVDSPAARDLIERALADREGPLYVLALGAMTNVTSAVLMEPTIAEHIVVVALGGWPHHIAGFRDFNFIQDIKAAQELFDCGVPLVHVPGFTVSELLSTTEAEMARHVKPHGGIGQFLYDNYLEFVPEQIGRGKPIWDLAPGAYLMDHAWMKTQIVPSPILTDSLHYAFDGSRHPIRVMTWIDRTAVFGDFFGKLQHAASAS